MTLTNEAAHKSICSNLREMHEMADMLMHPPEFKGSLYLSSK